jgi:fermentation-respiration switch protein FrsA (DUF1100 family)
MRLFIASATVLLLTGCTNLFFQPDHALHFHPDRVGAKWEDAPFVSADGTKLAGLWFPAKAATPKGVVVQFHGNGQNLTSHFLYVYWLALEGWDVFVFDYRAYGASRGEKSLSGAVADGAAALAYARSRAAGRPLVVIGQSLGGALALASLKSDGGAGVKALVLDSTFSSFQRVARERLTRWWGTWPLQWLAYVLVSDRYAPIRLIADRPVVPLLMFHAPGDPVVPFAEGRRLYDAATGTKEFWEIPGTGHTEALGARGDVYRPRVLAFLNAAAASER